MARVTRAGGVVAACVWDHAGRMPPAPYSNAARALDPDVDDESPLAGAREGHLAALFDAAGLREIEATSFSASVEHATFEAWWEPFTLGVGPAGAYVAGLDPDRRVELREGCRRQVPEVPFAVTAVAWAARGLA